MSLTSAIGKKASQARWLGVFIIVLGLLALAAPFAAGLYVTVMVGLLLLVSGVAQVYLAFRGSSLAEGIGLLLLGVLAVIAGGYVLLQPGQALVALTFVLAGFFFAQGLVEILGGVGARPDTGWGWLVASGVISVLLAVMIWSQSPLSGAWAIGTLVGIRLLLSGTSTVFIGSAVRSATESQPEKKYA